MLEEVRKLPGGLVLDERDVQNVLYRLALMGFSTVDAFRGVPMSTVLDMYFSDVVPRHEVPPVDKPGTRVLVHRIGAEADRPSESRRISAEQVLWKIARRVRRKRNVDKESSGDSDEDVSPFDLGAFLGEYVTVAGDARLLPPNWFADLTRLARLRRDVRGRASTAVPFVYSSTIDEWVPTWVGEARDRIEQKRIRKALQASPAASLAALLSLVSSFWLSHMAAGAVSLPAVFAHVLLLVKIAYERSVAFAFAYHSRLQARILADIKAGAAFSLDKRIAVVDQTVFAQVELEQLRSTTTSTPPGRGKKGRDEEASPGDKGSPGTPADAGKKGRGADAGRNGIAPPGRPVCFQHDPANSRKCTVKACRFEHVDTRTAEGAKVFAAAKAAAADRKAGR